MLKIISDNPASDVKKPTAFKVPMYEWSVEDIARLRASFDVYWEKPSSQISAGPKIAGQVIVDILDGHRAEGWVLENEPTYPCVFMRRPDERRMLTLCQVDPSGGQLLHFSPWRS